LGKKDHKYSIINKDDRAYIDIKIRTRRYQPIYMQLQTRGLKNIEVISDGEVAKKYETEGTVEVINLGKYNREKDITVRLNFKNAEGYWLMNRIYSLNLRQFNNLYNNLSENEYEISKYNDTNIIGDVTSTEDKSMLYTSIPYDDGWSVTIDGKKADKVELLNAFIGVEIPKGTHKVEFKYMPQGLKIGAIISGASLVLLILVCIVNRKKRRE
ncbi:YfhO family protein, partial [Clostridium baratii]